MEQRNGNQSEIFGRPDQPFVKRFALCYWTIVCLSICDVGVLWPNGSVEFSMPLSMVVGLDPGHSVLHGDPAPPQKGAQPPPQFSPHVCCGQTAGWIEMPLSTDVDLSPGHIVRWGPISPPHEKGHSIPPLFGPCLLWPNGCPSQQLLSSCYNAPLAACGRVN